MRGYPWQSKVGQCNSRQLLLPYPRAGDRRDDREGYDKSVKFLEERVDAAMSKHGLPSEKVIIGGFSQGAAVALLAALRSNRKLGGAVILSGWGALRGDWPALLGKKGAEGAEGAEGAKGAVAVAAAAGGAATASGAAGEQPGALARVLPLFWGHGTQDNVVQYSLGKANAAELRGVYSLDKLEWRDYPVAHGTHPREMQDIGRFLRARICD